MFLLAVFFLHLCSYPSLNNLNYQTILTHVQGCGVKTVLEREPLCDKHVCVFRQRRHHAGGGEMAHIVDHLLSAHHLGPVHEQRGGQAERKEDPVGSNLTGY